MEHSIVVRRWIVTRHPLNGTPTISSLTVCFINTSTPEIVGNGVFVLHFYYPHAIFTLLHYLHGKPGVILYHPEKRILEIGDF
ncbi:hypothetical protein OUZ56_027143 [Daphnia magna]|uniref:Uncharacterized protein n=1 Tax=Daphnia magna TaxID=35525 RepID=A0ABQ9ZNV8_9CRUS|nr:hypothetical protein OUZ56_027143 [Daphnia magna]